MQDKKKNARAWQLTGDWLTWLSLAVLFIEMIINSIVAFPTVSGHSMLPNFVNGETVMVRRQYWTPLPLLGLKTGIKISSPKRDQVVIAEAKKRLYGRNIDDLIIKRVIGMPGENVAVANNRVYINQKPVKEYYQKGNTVYSNITGKEANVLPKYFINERMNMNNTLTGKPIALHLQSDQYWLMGDNRNHSSDSRVFGPFSDSRILGTVVDTSTVNVIGIQHIMNAVLTVIIVTGLIISFIGDRKMKQAEDNLPDTF